MLQLNLKNETSRLRAVVLGSAVNNGLIELTGDNKKGINLMNEALQIREQQNDSYGSIESYLHLTDYYFDSNKIKAKGYICE